ncbi:MAG: DUF3047 domain-containing protein [Burkholderiales bacterium]|nr:DUF3047 domain-containing protein [Pseudomonadota bacterium]
MRESRFLIDLRLLRLILSHSLHLFGRVFRFRSKTGADQHGRRCFTVGVLALVAIQTGCALAPKDIGRPAVTKVTPFSAAMPGGPFPGGWQELRFSKFRTPTLFELFNDGGTTVVRATSENSSSALVESIDVDPLEYPVLHWRWKAPRLVPGANTTRRKTEDAPVRLIIAFAGDKQKLSFADQMTFAETRALLGLDPPYATLEYVWGDGAAKESIVQNGWNARIRLLLVESGAKRLGKWILESRNVVEDFRRAFGEEPGRITSIGIHCDSDATESRSEGYFGDIEFLRREEADRATNLRPTGR